MILYQCSEHGDSIKQVESERQTEKSVWINGNRHAWTSYWSSFFETKEKAKKYLIDHCLRRLESHENAVQREKDKLSRINVL